MKECKTTLTINKQINLFVCRVRVQTKEKLNELFTL